MARKQEKDVTKDLDLLIEEIRDSLEKAAGVLPKARAKWRSAQIADLAAADHLFLAGMTQVKWSLTLLKKYTD
jgi:hypothetical protein